MIVRHTRQQINEYFERTDLNQSSLKLILTSGMQKYLEEPDIEIKEKRHLKVGSGVDCKITMEEETFLREFYVSNLEKIPGDGAMLAIKKAFSIVSQKFRVDDIGNLDEYPEEVWQGCNEAPYYNNRAKADWSEDTRIASLIKENGREYWKSLCEATGKMVLSVDENDTINTVSNSILNHPHTNWIFRDSNQIDIVYQLPIYFTFMGVRCKVLLDILRIDHSLKIIYPLDIKTTGNYVTKFSDDVRSYRYDIQGSFYTHGLREGILHLSKLIGRDLRGYTIGKFAFIAESTSKPGVPLVFPMSEKLIANAETGTKFQRGWLEALQIYIAWAEHGFNMERVFKSHSGIVHINEDYKYNLNRSLI